MFDDDFDLPEDFRPHRATIGGSNPSTNAIFQMNSLAQARSSRQQAAKKAARQEVEQLKEKRERLVETIVIEEDNIIDFHKQFIDSMIGCIKENSETFQNLNDQRRLLSVQGVPFDDYILQLNKELEREERLISKLRLKLDYYNKKVQEEQRIQQKLDSLTQDDSFGEVFDLRQDRTEGLDLLDD